MPSATSAPLESRVAHQVLSRSLGVRSGQSVVIESWTHTLPWAAAFVTEARKLGAHPIVLYEDEEAYWNSVGAADPKVVGTMGASEQAAVKEADAYVFFWGPADRARLQSLPDKTRSALLAFNPKWYTLASKAGLRGCRMELGRATPAAAKRFGVDLATWQSQLVQGTLTDLTALQRRGRKLTARLAKGRDVVITHPNGTRLSLKLRGRDPINDDAVVDAADVRAHHAMTPIPGGVVTVAIDERAAEGTFLANRTSYLMSGPATEGKWTFEGGRLTALDYETGGLPVKAALEKAAKGADRPAFLSIGLNPELRNTPNLEDQEAGVVCVAVGGNDFYGGATSNPFMTWIALAGATVTVDGHPLVKGGRIVDA